MNRNCLYVLIVMAIHSFCHAQVTKLPAGDLKVLTDVSRFHQIQAATNLPPEVFALCADKRHRLAEPGQKWEEGDYIIDQTLPRQRLRWAVTDDNYYVVHCERGGYVLSYFVLVAKLKAGESKPSFVWRAGASRELRDFKEFLAALATNDLNDSRSP